MDIPTVEEFFNEFKQKYSTSRKVLPTMEEGSLSIGGFTLKKNKDQIEIECLNKYALLSEDYFVRFMLLFLLMIRENS